MKALSLFIFLAISSNVFAMQSKCGKAVGFSFNHDTIERPYRLSGFFIKQNTDDVRITYGTSAELIEDVEAVIKTGRNIFVCMDNYELETRMYAGQERTYGIVSAYRVWQNGKLVIEKN